MKQNASGGWGIFDSQWSLRGGIRLRCDLWVPREKHQAAKGSLSVWFLCYTAELKLLVPDHEFALIIKENIIGLSLSCPCTAADQPGTSVECTVCDLPWITAFNLSIFFSIYCYKQFKLFEPAMWLLLRHLLAGNGYCTYSNSLPQNL